MSYWIGPRAAIEATNTAAAAHVVGRPEYRDGAELPPDQWVTTYWAVPTETATAGVWAIPAYPGMGVPDGCEAVGQVDWQEGE